jgi:hypothetical protein
MAQLTQSQFATAQDKIDAAIRAAKHGTPERAAAESASVEWEKAITLPQRSWQDRQARLAAIAEVATRLGLVG